VEGQKATGFIGMLAKEDMTAALKNGGLKGKSEVIVAHVKDLGLTDIRYIDLEITAS
jgi:hypothetical protein